MISYAISYAKYGGFLDLQSPKSSKVCVCVP